MRIIAWNCNMCFRNKIDALLELSPQLVVVPECENIEKLKESADFHLIKDAIWHGDNKHKGIGVFSFSSNIKLRTAEWYNDNYKYIVPIHVELEDESWLIFAIWACNPKLSKYSYVEQIYQAILYYSNYISEPNTLLIGDFNSNTIWDKEHQKYGSHSMLVNLLESFKITSSYHTFYDEQHGSETTPTLYMYRHIDKPYHIDYSFLSANFYNRLQNVQIGQPEVYLSNSDHMPLILDFE